MSYRARRTVSSWFGVIARLALLIALTMALTGIASVARAQDARPARRGGLELRPFTGACFPTGEQRDLLRDACLVGAQAASSAASVRSA